MVHQDLCIEDLHEALIPKGNDGDALVGADLTEYRSVLGKLNWLQSRTQFHMRMLWAFPRLVPWHMLPSLA